MTVRIKATKMVDADVRFISLVARGANRAPFKVIKQEKSMSNLFKGLDLGSLFARKSEPVLIGVAVMKEEGDDFDDLAAQIQEAGFDTDDLMELEDGSAVFKQEGSGDPTGDVTVVRMSDDTAVVCKGFRPYSMDFTDGDLSFADQCTAQGFYPSISTVVDVVRQRIMDTVQKADDPSAAAADVTKMFGEVAKYTQSLIAGLPSKAFKLESVQKKCKPKGKGKDGDHDDTGTMKGDPDDGGDGGAGNDDITQKDEGAIDPSLDFMLEVMAEVVHKDSAASKKAWLTRHRSAYNAKYGNIDAKAQATRRANASAKAGAGGEAKLPTAKDLKGMLSTPNSRYTHDATDPGFFSDAKGMQKVKSNLEAKGYKVTSSGKYEDYGVPNKMTATHASGHTMTFEANRSHPGGENMVVYSLQHKLKKQKDDSFVEEDVVIKDDLSDGDSGSLGKADVEAMLSEFGESLTAKFGEMLDSMTDGIKQVSERAAKAEGAATALKEAISGFTLMGGEGDGDGSGSGKGNLRAVRPVADIDTAYQPGARTRRA